VTLMLVFDPDEQQVADVITRAHVALARFRQREREYRMWTAAQLNKKRWNDEDDWADEDIANMLMIATFEFNGEGQLDIYWDDSELLFWGHNLLTIIDPDGEPVSAGMQ
jgi:hypothetical protein